MPSFLHISLLEDCLLWNWHILRRKIVGVSYKSRLLWVPIPLETIATGIKSQRVRFHSNERGIYVNSKQNSTSLCSRSSRWRKTYVEHYWVIGWVCIAEEDMWVPHFGPIRGRTGKFFFSIRSPYESLWAAWLVNPFHLSRYFRRHYVQL